MSEAINHEKMRKLALSHLIAPMVDGFEPDTSRIARAYLALAKDRDALHATLGDAGMAAMHAEERVESFEIALEDAQSRTAEVEKDLSREIANVQRLYKRVAELETEVARMNRERDAVADKAMVSRVLSCCCGDEYVCKHCVIRLAIRERGRRRGGA